MVSIADVAARAGVSQGTVSNTLNRPEIVSHKTRERVLAAIAALGYVANQHARQLGGAMSRVIGLVVIDVSNPFFTEASRGVEDAATEADHAVILCNSDDSVDREERHLRTLASERVRGVLITPSRGTRSAHRILAEHDIPFVYLDRQGSGRECSVAVDDVQGGDMAMTHLLELGHRHVAYVAGPTSVRQHADRLDGARQAVTRFGLNPAEAIVVSHNEGMDIRSGSAAIDLLLQRRRRPTAVFCANDVLAFGAYRALARHGVRVPDDLALIGYDDVDFAADWIVPLSSVRQPTRRLGYEAARLLLDHSSGRPDHEHQQIVFQPELVVRQSTAG
ncbi:LacI family DNA-binding transcriptional regulator [Jiangella alba]|uniref:Transcriptional regulator, LacI family n=1 Tax=Jiangella alba TaxID=561176 RepID=A0A1H5Q0G9_9ACTN|nr:LacI family DNA-binding transcriptional regulator [Jiangella alba]SEF18938.1 transcriptional regulator, LacI family [Jiangella alba]